MAYVSHTLNTSLVISTLIAIIYSKCDPISTRDYHRKDSTSFFQNDILGPAGFGDAHFIPPDLIMDYRIRFENDPNATAPAQRVFIRHQLDDDLDIRSFRIGEFGFGDFTREVTIRRCILQVGGVMYCFTTLH